MDVYAVSLRGIREQNEDKHVICINGGGKDNTIANINFYGIFDGHGGKFVSKFLSKHLPPIFTNKQMNYPISSTTVNKIYDYLQSVLKQNYKTDATHCGSTCLVASQFVKDGANYVNIINLGDSRCVLCRDNMAIALTKDHKPNWPEERVRIHKLGGEVKRDRDGEWRIQDLSVSRAFGDLDSDKYVTHIPELFRYKLENSDKFMVMACDGLWDVMSNQDVINFIIDICYDDTFMTRKNKNVNIARLLGEHAIKIGSSDNITIEIIFFK
jgi:serine/threonine protein phosphatase PrpC